MLSPIVAEEVDGCVLAGCFGFSPKQRPNSRGRYAALRRDEVAREAQGWESRAGFSYKSAGAFDRPVIYATMALTMGSGPAVFH